MARALFFKLGLGGGGGLFFKLGLGGGDGIGGVQLGLGGGLFKLGLGGVYSSSWDWAGGMV